MRILDALARVLTAPLPPAELLPAPRRIVAEAATAAKQEAQDLVKGLTELDGHPVDKVVRNLRLVASQNGHRPNGKAAR